MEHHSRTPSADNDTTNTETMNATRFAEASLINGRDNGDNKNDRSELSTLELEQAETLGNASDEIKETTPEDNSVWELNWS